MKKTIEFLFLFILVVLFSCNNRKQRTNEADKPQNPTTVDSTDFNNLNSFYPQMEITYLPFVANNVNSGEGSGLLVFPDKIFDKIPFSPRTYADLKGARFPAYESIKIITVTYTDSLNNPVRELITFRPEFQFADRIKLFAIENVAGKENQRIVTESAVNEWENIEITKKLNGILIESLHYQISSDGTISEIRDGKTPSVAFESFDNETYYIENFIWKTLPNGGLSKSNLRKKIYTVATDGKVREIKQ